MLAQPGRDMSADIRVWLGVALAANGAGMRRKNWRLVIVGVVMIVMAVAFFLGMGTLAPKSNDPVALMQTVGQVSGVVGALGLVPFVFGLIGKKR